MVVRYEKGKEGYPTCLKTWPSRPLVITASGPFEEQKNAVAIVGSRDAIPESIAFAEELAFTLASRGIVIISGGARGVDTAAHEGALRAGGATWCVSPVGRNHVYPPKNRALFERIAACPRSRMIWPHDDDQEYAEHTPRFRNALLVGLAKTVVVVQAHFKSGSRNAAGWARDFDRELWVVPAAPWMKSFDGSHAELTAGARPLWSVSHFLVALGLEPPELEGKRTPRQESLFEPDTTGWTENETRVFSVTSDVPQTREQLATKAGLAYTAAVSSLLTLSLKDVVVESPNGYSRRSKRR